MTKKVIFCAVLGTLCWHGATWAQTSGTDAVSSPSASASAPESSQRPQTGLSSWITYERNNCCQGNVGCDTPIGTELFVRIGPSVPFGDDILGRNLRPGWMIALGGRALFFNQPMDRAWFIEVSGSNAYNHSGPRVPLPFPSEPDPVAVEYYNRTFVNLGIGREWYLFPATDMTRNWRVGIDTGGRYGSASLGRETTHHVTDVVGGFYVGFHSDLEFPVCAWGNSCVFQAGFRIEYGYTFSDILSQRSDLQELNLLFNFGVRY